MFITFEGGDGGGKTTQIRLLKDRLSQTGRDVVLTREPGGTPEAEKIRALVLQSGNNWSPITETLMMFAARAMHVRDLIKPALDAGKIVLCDRFTDSTRAYQGYAGGMDLSVIEDLKRITIGDLEPDRTIVLDIPAATGLARSTSGTAEGAQEEKGIAFQEKLRAGYLAIARQNPHRCTVVDAAREIDVVAADIWKVFA
jgi:dTMP kinase